MKWNNRKFEDDIYNKSNKKEEKASYFLYTNQEFNVKYYDRNH